MRIVLRWHIICKRLGYVNVPEIEKGLPSQVVDEEAGQLYAYRLNESAVILGTRDSETLGASVGIKPVASGLYECVTQNINQTEVMPLTISVEGMFLSFYIKYYY